MINLDTLISENKPVYVINKSKPKGDVTITAFRPDGAPKLIIIPKTWIPICVTEQVTAKTISNSDDFRAILNKGMLQLIDPEVAIEALKEPDALLEKNKLSISQYGTAENVNIERFKDSIENVGDVSIKVQDILNRDITMTEMLSLLRTEEDELGVEDFKYIVANTKEGKLKDWAAQKI